MDIKTLLAKKAAELTAEERAFLKAHEGELTEDQRTEYLKADDEVEDVVEGEPSGDEEPGTTEENGAPDGLNTSPPQGDPVPQDSTTASEKPGTVTMTAAEKEAYEARITAGENAMKELRTMKMGEKVRGWLFSDKGTGKFFPGVKDELQELALTFSDRQMALWEKLVAAMPDVRLFTEIGDANDTPVNAGESLHKIAEAKYQEAVKAGDNRQYAEFFKLAGAEHPELVARYEQESKQASTN